MMQEFQTNYTAKHGTRIPPPKLYMDEGDSEEEGIQLMMEQFMEEELLQIQLRSHQEAQVVQDGELEEVRRCRGAGRGGSRQEQALRQRRLRGRRLQGQAAQEAGGSGGGGAGGSGGNSGGGGGGGDPPGDPGRGRKAWASMTMMTMTTPKTIQTRSPSWIHQEEQVPNRSEGKPRGGKGARGGKQPRKQKFTVFWTLLGL